MVSAALRWLDNEQRTTRAFFAITLLIGLLSFRQFGVPVDAGTMDSLGRDAYAYVFLGAEWPENPAWRYHGTAVELPLQIIQNFVADPENKPTMNRRLFTQHVAIFLIFWAGMIALYALAKRRFDSWKWALLACLLLFVSPRIFAHAFYNSRDIPVMTLFTVSMLTLSRLSDRRTYTTAIIHGIASGAALGIRIPALIIPALTVAYLVHDALRDRWTDNVQSMRKTVSLSVIYAAALCITVYCLWPFLWSSPLSHFAEAYSFMSSLGQETVFLGRTYFSTPWHYIALWILITVPLCFSLFFLVGACEILFSAIRHPIASILRRQHDVLFFAWFMLPILAIVITGAGIYNEWHHIYFVYPAFVLIAVSGVQWTTAQLHTRWNATIAGIPSLLIGLQLLATTGWMVWNHPMEFAYFSIPSSIVQHYFIPPRADYWGLSYREAIRSLLQEHTGIISIYSPENIAFQNAYNVFPESLGRIMRVPTINDAMYVLVPDPSLAEGLPLVRELRVDNLYLSGVYKGPVNEVIVNRATRTVDFRR